MHIERMPENWEQALANGDYAESGARVKFHVLEALRAVWNAAFDAPTLDDADDLELFWVTFMEHPEEDPELTNGLWEYPVVHWIDRHFRKAQGLEALFLLYKWISFQEELPDVLNDYIRLYRQICEEIEADAFE